MLIINIINLYIRNKIVLGLNIIYILFFILEKKEQEKEQGWYIEEMVVNKEYFS